MDEKSREKLLLIALEVIKESNIKLTPDQFVNDMINTYDKFNPS